MADMHPDQQFLEYVVKAIVNNPDSVRTTRTVDERGVLITLDVSPTDIGYVIGRQGQTVRAIRTLLRVVGAKNNASVNLKINEPRPPRPAPNERGPGSFGRRGHERDRQYRDLDWVTTLAKVPERGFLLFCRKGLDFINGTCYNLFVS